MKTKMFYAIVCALMCAFAVACSTPDEPIQPRSDGLQTSETAATRAGQTIVIDEYTRLELPPGSTLNAAALADALFIVGPNGAATGVEETYSVARPIDYDVIGWEIITGTNYSVRGRLDLQNLYITFNSEINYTIKVEYTTPDDRTGYLYKDVVVDNTPEITGLTWEGLNPHHDPTPGNYVDVTAHGALDGVTLDWIKGQGCDTYGGYVRSNFVYSYLIASNYTGDYVTVSCRAKRKNWGSTVILHIPVMQVNRAPAPLIVEELEEEPAE